MDVTSGFIPRSGKKPAAFNFLQQQERFNQVIGVYDNE